MGQAFESHNWNCENMKQNTTSAIVTEGIVDASVETLAPQNMQWANMRNGGLRVPNADLTCVHMLLRMGYAQRCQTAVLWDFINAAANAVCLPCHVELQRLRAMHHLL